MSGQHPPFPAFDEASVLKKVLGVEAAWKMPDAEKVSLASCVDSEWRNRRERQATVRASVRRRYQRHPAALTTT